MILNLGVTDVPYAHKDGQTTGEVAQILEDKYGVMQGFVDKHEEFIAKSIEDSVAGELESLLMGKTEVSDPFQTAMGKIETRFRDYLTKEETGFRPKTQLTGSRFKRQYRRTTKKIAFVDTGLYRRNFKAWVSG